MIHGLNFIRFNVILPNSIKLSFDIEFDQITLNLWSRSDSILCDLIETKYRDQIGSNLSELMFNYVSSSAR